MITNKANIKKIQSQKLDYKKAGMFLHCKHCMDGFLGGGLHEIMTPRDFGMYEISDYPFEYPDGATANIMAVWCKRCGRRVWDSRHLQPLY